MRCQPHPAEEVPGSAADAIGWGPGGRSRRDRLVAGAWAALGLPCDAMLCQMAPHREPCIGAGHCLAGGHPEWVWTLGSYHGGGSCSPGKILDKHRLLNKQCSPRRGLSWALNAFDLFIVL